MRCMKRRDGAVLATVLVSLLVLLGCAALSIDVGIAVLAKQQLQTAADAAALAGITSLQTSLDDTVASQATVDTAKANTVLGTALTLDPSVDVQVGAWIDSTQTIKPFDHTGGVTAVPDGVVAVKVTARRTTGSPDGPIAMHFAQVLGKPTVNVTATAVSSLTISLKPRSPIEVSICQDQSGSFEAEFPYARTGSVGLVNFLSTGYMSNDKLGYVGFGYQPYSSNTTLKRDINYFHDSGLNSTQNNSGGSVWLGNYINGVSTITQASNTGTNLWTGMLRSALEYCSTSTATTAWTTFTNSLTVSGTFYDIGWWNSTSTLKIGTVTKTRLAWLQGYMTTLLNTAYANTSANHVMIICSDGMPYYHLNGYPDQKAKDLCTWIADQLAARNVRIHTVCLEQESVPADGSRRAGVVDSSLSCFMPTKSRRPRPQMA